MCRQMHRVCLDWEDEVEEGDFTRENAAAINKRLRSRFDWESIGIDPDKKAKLSSDMPKIPLTGMPLRMMEKWDAMYDWSSVECYGGG